MSKITHEQAKKGLLKVYLFSNVQSHEENYVLVRDYITQQEKLESSYHNFKWETDETVVKQEKLLELYKKLSNLYEELYTMELSALSLNSNYYEIEIIKLKQQIKELENERT